jgi:hypothetical protein
MTSTFKVATVRPDQGSSWGVLSIAREAIDLDSSPVARRLATQVAGPVTIVTARWAPPPWRTAVIVRGATGCYGAGLTSRAEAKRVREALGLAGFEIQEQGTRVWRFPRAAFAPGF